MHCQTDMNNIITKIFTAVSFISYAVVARFMYCTHLHNVELTLYSDKLLFCIYVSWQLHLTELPLSDSFYLHILNFVTFCSHAEHLNMVSWI